MSNLTHDELFRASESRAFVLKHMPEIRPLIAELVAEGMIDGWRNVINCCLLDNSTDGTQNVLGISSP